MPADSSTVPAEAALIRRTKVGSAAPSALNLTPTCTALIVSSEAISAGVAARVTSSTWSRVVLSIIVVTSSGVTSSTSVYAPVQSAASPAPSGSK